jgi:hypothetical protein
MSGALRDRPATQRGTAARVEAIDWPAITADLDDQGWAVFPKLLAPAECQEIAGLYAVGGRFRSRVVMARHGFGRGEYQYFAYPLPDLVEGLRGELYLRLFPITPPSSSAATRPVKPARPRCCCSMVRATITACTRTSMASMSSRCR